MLGQPTSLPLQTVYIFHSTLFINIIEDNLRESNLWFFSHETTDHIREKYKEENFHVNVYDIHYHLRDWSRHFSVTQWLNVIWISTNLRYCVCINWWHRVHRKWIILIVLINIKFNYCVGDLNLWKNKFDDNDEKSHKEGRKIISLD